MGSKSSIQWTDATWNPVTGCTKVSQGCKNCYAERVFPRAYGRRQVPVDPRIVPDTHEMRPRRFTDVRTHPDRLDQPLRWKRPRRIFVNSMSDLFHDDVPFRFIDSVFAVMDRAEQHTFQVLTKRPKRMRAFCEALNGGPLSNVWLGVSVEDQATAEERIPLLLQTPAAVRFVSYEPALGPVNFTQIETHDFRSPIGTWCDALSGAFIDSPTIDWLIIGGESGPKARTFDVAWARSTIAQCMAAGVACFVKQLGANIRDRNDTGFSAEEETWAEGPDAGLPTRPEAWPTPVDVEDLDATVYQGAPVRVRLRDRAGGDPSEWPLDLRVRDFP